MSASACCNWPASSLLSTLMVLRRLPWAIARATATVFSSGRSTVRISWPVARHSARQTTRMPPTSHMAAWFTAASLALRASAACPSIMLLRASLRSSSSPKVALKAGSSARAAGSRSAWSMIFSAAVM